MLLKNKLDKMQSFLKNNNVLANLEERYCYANDASNIKYDFKIPDLVVFAETIEDVQTIVKYANQHEIPIIARGAGTNMVGACVCNKGGIILNFSKMNKILEINPQNMTAKVQPGVILGHLKNEVESLGLYYPPDPSNYKISTIGGSIALCSGGAKSFKYGTTKNYILSLKVVTADGTLMTLGTETSKNALGYHLAQRIVGSEGTLAIVVEATLKLIPKPETSSVILAYFNDVYKMTNAINAVNLSGACPASIDFMDKNSIKTVEEFLSCGLNIYQDYLLLIDLDGSQTSISEQKNNIESILIKSGSTEIIFPTDTEAQRIWEARRTSFAAATRLAPDVVSDDIIVPRDKLAIMILECNKIAKKYTLKTCIVGHAGDGNIHPQFVLNLNNENEFKNYCNAKSEIYNFAKKLNGTISAEHGIGLEKLAYIDNFIDKNALEYMKLIKKTFDPKNILNPGKIFMEN